MAHLKILTPISFRSSSSTNFLSTAVNLLRFAQSLVCWRNVLNHLNAELNPICHLLALLATRHILYVSRIRVNSAKQTAFDSGLVNQYILLLLNKKCVENHPPPVTVLFQISPLHIPTSWYLRSIFILRLEKPVECQRWTICYVGLFSSITSYLPFF